MSHFSKNLEQIDVTSRFSAEVISLLHQAPSIFPLLSRGVRGRGVSIILSHSVLEHAQRERETGRPKYLAQPKYFLKFKTKTKPGETR